MRRPPIVILAVMFSVLAPVPAGAQPAAPAPTAARQAAVATANKGQELFDAGRYEEALVQFQKAEAQLHAPTFMVKIASTYEQLGKLLEARKVYLHVVDEKLPQYAPQAMFDAQLEAKKALDALLPRIPTLRVLVTGAPAKDVYLTIDGQEEAPDHPVSLNPGEHTIAASAPDRIRETITLKLAPGAREQITIDLPLTPARQPRSDRAATPRPQPPSAPQPPQAPEPEYRLSAGTFTLLGGGVLVGAGAVLGAVSIGEVGELGTLCSKDGTCYDAAADTYHSAQTLGVLSTVAFAVGGAVVATGVVLVAMDGFRRPVETSLVVGPGFAGVKGRF